MPATAIGKRVQYFHIFRRLTFYCSYVNLYGTYKICRNLSMESSARQRSAVTVYSFMISSSHISLPAGSGSLMVNFSATAERKSQKKRSDFYEQRHQTCTDRNAI